MVEFQYSIRKCVISSNHYKNQNPPVLVTSRSCADLEVRSRQVMRIDKISPIEVNVMVIQKQPMHHTYRCQGSKLAHAHKSETNRN